MRYQNSIATASALALLVLGAALLLWPESSGALLKSRRPPIALPATLLPPLEIEPVAKPAAQVTPEIPTVQRRPLIDVIELDKTRVCPGETLRADVRKRNEIKNPVFFNVPGFAKGSPAILSFDEPGEQVIHVVANDGVGGLDFKSTQVEVLNAETAECAAKSMLFVSAGVSGLEEDTAEIRVQVPPSLGGNLRYSYGFGDGTSADSSSAYVTHNYQLRDQSEPTSSFVIDVRAENERGKTATGRASVSFRNVYWLSTVVGSPMIPVVYDRFAERRGSSYETRVTFKNIDELPIELSNAALTVDRCVGADSPPKTYTAATILNGLDRLEGGQSHTTTLSLPEADVAGACRVILVVEGDTIPGRAGMPIGPGFARKFDTTRANISLEIAAPPQHGALQAAAPIEVSDETMLSKLERAQAILGKDKPITPEALKRLEREGRLN